MRGITKRFPGVLASDHVDFDVKSGEVHALLGENGAGKSTLMKILYGLYHPDEGEILLNGKPVRISSPTDSINLGIGMIHQHFMLVQTLTVAENVALGLPSSRGALTDLDRVSKRIVELADIYGLKIDPAAYIWQLSVGQQQRVEIIKALYRGAALLILDEPTAVLTPQEVDELFVIMNQMVKDGHALIFISHKLHEVVEISHRVTVLRDGRKIGTRPTSETTKQDLANWMVGREIGFTPDRGKVECGESRLQLEQMYPAAVTAARRVCAVSALKCVRVRFWALRASPATVNANWLKPSQACARSPADKSFWKARMSPALLPADLTDRMLSYIPEERMRDGMIKDFTVAENMILREHQKMPYSRYGFLNLRDISSHADELITKFHVKTPSRETHAKNLSGGNIQKIVLAREIFRTPRVIIAAQPTRGLDIGATEYVREQLLEQRKQGVAIMLISEDLDEILALSDRIAVIYEGQVMDIVPRADATPEKLGLLMAGVHPEEGISQNS